MDIEGNIKGSAHKEYSLIIPQPGWAEHNPETYWNAVCETINRAISQSGVSSSEIRGVGFSSHAPACILVDERGRPLQNAIIWMDRRSTKECRLLSEDLGDDNVFKLSGNRIDPYFGIPKLLWEKNNRPESFKKCFRALNVTSYVIMRLTDEVVIDYSNASLMGIAFDIRNRCWDEKTLDVIGLNRDILPPIEPCNKVVGEITQESSKEIGLAPGTPVVAGTLDTNASLLAMEVLEESQSALVMGTAGSWGICHTTPRFFPELINTIHVVDSDIKYTAIGAIGSCCALLQHFKENFGLVEDRLSNELRINPYDVMNLEAESAPAGCDGLIALPHFMGELAPLWNPLARGVFFGMSLYHRRGHVVRALMEGAAYGILRNIEVVRNSELLIKPPVVLGGGGAKNRLWRQIICDVLCLPGRFLTEPHDASVGDVVNVGVATGLLPGYQSIKAWRKRGLDVEPNQEKGIVYKKYYQIFKTLYENLRGQFDSLAEIVGHESVALVKGCDDS
jgi:xylulokinase